MNETLIAGEQCVRILREFETAPAKWPQTKQGAALVAYPCPSRQWTLWFGCCFWPDGTPVKEGDEIFDETVGEAMMAYCVKDAEAYVRRHVTTELTQNQFDALVSFRFNTRETTLAKSTRLLPAVNARKWDEAAEAFCEFIYGSSTYDGKPYQVALRGLLRRRLWEALIFLGYDPEQAVKDGDVALGCDRVLLASGVYRDRLRPEGVTSLRQVLPKAREYPLKPTNAGVSPPAPAAAPAPLPPARQAPSPVSVPKEPAVVSKEPPKADVTPAPVSKEPRKVDVTPPPAPAPAPRPTAPPPPPVVIAPQPVNPNALPTHETTTKNMADSTRMIGMVLVGIGSVVQVVSLRLGIGTAFGAVFFDLTRDPVIITLATTSIVAALGWATTRRGKKTFARGADQAVTGLH